MQSEEEAEEDEDYTVDKRLKEYEKLKELT